VPDPVAVILFPAIAPLLLFIAPLVMAMFPAASIPLVRLPLPSTA